MTADWESPFLERAAEEVAEAVKSAGLTRRQAQALAKEELRLLDRVGGSGDRYHSLRVFLEALCSPNGLIVALDLAIGGRVAPARYAAFCLGILREDVWLVPLLGALPSPSPGHIYPRSRRRCARLFAEAVGAADAGQADVLLGRALHVLLDMACPVHAQNVWHYLRDPYERYVDAHAADLASLPVPAPPAWAGPEALVDSLAGAARMVRADRRQTPWGRWLRRDEKPLPRHELAWQARHLVPLAAAHARTLVEGLDQCRA